MIVCDCHKAVIWMWDNCPNAIFLSTLIKLCFVVPLCFSESRNVSMTVYFLPFKFTPSTFSLKSKWILCNIKWAESFLGTFHLKLLFFLLNLTKPLFSYRTLGKTFRLFFFFIILKIKTTSNQMKAFRFKKMVLLLIRSETDEDSVWWKHSLIQWRSILFIIPDVVAEAREWEIDK